MSRGISLELTGRNAWKCKLFVLYTSCLIIFLFICYFIIVFLGFLYFILRFTEPLLPLMLLSSPYFNVMFFNMPYINYRMTANNFHVTRMTLGITAQFTTEFELQQVRTAVFFNFAIWSSHHVLRLAAYAKKSNAFLILSQTQFILR